MLIFTLSLVPKCAWMFESILTPAGSENRTQTVHDMFRQEAEVETETQVDRSKSCSTAVKRLFFKDGFLTKLFLLYFLLPVKISVLENVIAVTIISKAALTEIVSSFFSILSVVLSDYELLSFEYILV